MKYSSIKSKKISFQNTIPSQNFRMNLCFVKFIFHLTIFFNNIKMFRRYDFMLKSKYIHFIYDKHNLQVGYTP
jgi:hypothetical protein